VPLTRSTIRPCRYRKRHNQQQPSTYEPPRPVQPMGSSSGIPAFDISRFMGHAKPTTTLGIYAHLFEDNHADAMAALGAMGSLTPSGNVIRLRG